LDAVLCGTLDEIGFCSVGFQVLGQLSEELGNMVRDGRSIQLFGATQ
jgi:hypothetical protein